MSLSHSMESISWISDFISRATASSSSELASICIKIPGKTQPGSVHWTHLSSRMFLLTCISIFTQKLVDGSLITEVLVDWVFTWRRHGSQHSDTMLHLGLFTDPSSCGDTVAPTKVSFWETWENIHYCEIKALTAANTVNGLQCLTVWTVCVWDVVRHFFQVKGTEASVHM